MDSHRNAQSSTVTSQTQSKPVGEDRGAQLAAARQRALEVRKQRSEERKELKRQEQESEKLRLEKVKLENERLRKEIESSTNSKSDENPKSPKRQKTTDPNPKVGEKNEETKGSVASPSKEKGEKRAREEDTSDDDTRDDKDYDAADKLDAPDDPLIHMASKIDKLSSMFEEEMQYKKKKRETKEKESKRVAEADRNRRSALRADPTYTAYMNSTKNTMQGSLMSHVFG